MTDLEQRVSEFCAAPAGCAFLLIVEQNELDPARVTTPDVAYTIACYAIQAVIPWDGDHDEKVAHVLSEGPRLTGLAREVLSQPGAAEWFAPLRREAQVWLGSKGAILDLTRIVTPSEPPGPWERYAQKTAGGLYTSTAVDDLSAVLIAIREGTGDYIPEPPYTRYLLRAASSARVFDVTGPGTWHALCRSYPAHGEDGRTVPDWSAVAQDWDGVHLTLGGLLTAEQVRVEEGALWTEHTGWESEQTIWLRNCFTGVTRLPDVSSVPESDQSIDHWWYWGPDWDDNPKPWRGKMVIELEDSAGEGIRG